MKHALPIVTACLLCWAGTRPAPLTAQRLSLAAAVDSALAHHPSIARARASEESAAAGLSAADAARLPTLEAGFGVQRFEEPMITTPIHAFDPNLVPAFDETLVQGTLGLRYTVVDWGARRAGIGGARAGVGMAAADARATRMALIRAVADAYLGLVSARAVDAAAEARLVALNEELSRARRAFDAGTAAEVEVLRASAAAQDAAAARTTTTGAVRLAERSLARVTGLPDGLVASSTLDPIAAPPPRPPDEREPGLENGPASVSLPGRDVSENPRVELAVRRMHAAAARTDAERSTRLPRLDLTAALHDYGTVSDDHTLEWQAGLRLSWTVFAGGARSSRIRGAEADLRAAESAVGEAELAALEAVDAARTAIEAADALFEALRASVGQWEELVRIERLALDAGAGTQRDLLEAEAGLFQARAGLTDAARQTVMARVGLAEAQGSLDLGWLQENLGGTR